MSYLKVFSVAALAFLASTAYAGSAVVGQVTASPSAYVGSQSIKNQQVPYIQGDSVETGKSATASVSLTSGSATLELAPNTSMRVLSADEMAFELNSGALQVTAAAGSAVSFDTASGVFTVSSAQALNVIAVSYTHLTLPTKA